ncbi:phosphatidylglycerophosphatase A family protein [Pseudohaliea rubra]|uniref:Phosphatidylglycerophosphatase A n=1 Tax=Pseudohaliea rubra DSM 19751 TaxID=1265313 RepID=A0A095VMX8_9GAMM|nr:phosphatidylglycerophosphatase A [Pseudohaliea rubra]KGE02832.1 Phosphatidylglycerophosphatase A [Pseudohaliea rubra DSM 19751]
MGDHLQNQREPQAPALLRNPAQLAAFGFGSGLSPWAPGTVGTVAAAVIYWYLLAPLPLWAYSAVILAASVGGIWLCGVASRQLGVHDHPGIVWDEFAGLWVALWAVPASPLWLAIAFVVFRLLDIAKPWPVSVLDKDVGGGLGIMADDLVAGAMTCVTLHLAIAALSGAEALT